MTQSRVAEVHRRAIIVDGHCDTPYRLKRQKLGLSDRSPEAQVNLRMLQESGITASFFVSYVPPFYVGRGAADFARTLIKIIHDEARANREHVDLVTDPAGIRRAKANGKIALMIGIEGGHAIEDSLETLRQFYELGARYLTLTHVNSNSWADSSGDAPIHNGLTEFGREVVQTMNDLGMMVDISHVSDATFYHALETSRAPIIASHSSCRALARHPRNMTDQMLRDLAAAGGICMINFYTAFINDEIALTIAAAQKRSTVPHHQKGEVEELPDDKLDWDHFCRWYASLNLPVATLDDLLAHFVHAAEVAGVDHVGVGSDFDGVPALPEGMSNASFLPALTEGLMNRGFSDQEIEKILGGNFMRVFEQVEKARVNG